MSRRLSSPHRSHAPHRSRSDVFAGAPRSARGTGSARWGIALAASGALAAVAGFAAARTMARMPLVPQGPDERNDKRSDLTIRAVHADRIHLDANADATRPGFLAVTQGDEGRGIAHVRLGEVIGAPTNSTVARAVLGTDTPVPLQIGPADINGFFWHGTPEAALQLPTEEIEYSSPVGPMPAWLTPADPATAQRTGASGVWAILVHGHGAARGEGLRALPLLHALGITAMSIAYRNDPEAPATSDGLHHLGSTEYEDVEAAVAYARTHGAQRIVLMGWSMGGGMVLRTATLSPYREHVHAVVLVSPAVDWRAILDHHAQAMKVPALVRALALAMFSTLWGARALRLDQPLALPEMTAERYAETLRIPTLLTHAGDDQTVPIQASEKLAELADETVTFAVFAQASHTREWNRDPERWERLVADHLVVHLGLTIDADELELPVRSPAVPGESGVLSDHQ